MTELSAIQAYPAPAPSDDGRRIASARLGMLLFLATEIMFFMGLIVAYIVIRAGDPDLFTSQSHTLNRLAGSINTGVLILSSIIMALAVRAARAGRLRRTVLLLLATFTLGACFLGIKGYEYATKFTHYTIFARDPGNPRTAPWYIYDVHRTSVVREADPDQRGKIVQKSWHVEGRRREVGKKEPIDVHSYTPALDKPLQEAKPAEYDIPFPDILDFTSYGPQKNIFFSCYFTMTGAHAAHILGGMIAIGILLIGMLRRRTFPVATANIGLYWQFVDLVWLLLFALLYLA